MEHEKETIILILDTYLLTDWDNLPIIKTEKQGDFYVMLMTYKDKTISIVAEKGQSILDAMLNVDTDKQTTCTTVRETLKITIP
jgi:hypothetical protein